jgi:hypothetical protein
MLVRNEPPWQNQKPSLATSRGKIACSAEMKVNLMSTEIADAAKRFLDGLQTIKPEPRMIFFGEHHQTEAFRTKFTDFFFECAEKLCPDPVKFIFVELQHNSSADLNNYFLDQSTLVDYRKKWVRPGSMISIVPDSFFERLKALHNERNATIVAINSDDPGRDLLMDSTIRSVIGDSGRGLAWVGGGHALRRPAAERKDWQSCLELLEDANVPCGSIVECSRRDLLDCRSFDHNLEQLLNANKQLGMAFVTELGAYSNIVSDVYTIGTENILPEFDRCTIYFRFRNYDAVFIDPERFLSEGEERERRGNPADYSNCR